MILPRWLDRERRLYEARLLARSKTQEARVWFGLWRNLTAELSVARAERDNAREDLDAARRELDAAKQAHQSARSEHFAEMKALQDEKRRWERAAEQAIVPAVSVPVRPDDRAALYRLEAECARLRDLLLKYEGATP